MAAVGLNLQNPAPLPEAGNPRQYHDEDLIAVYRGNEVVFRCPPEGARIQPLLQVDNTFSHFALGAIAGMLALPIVGLAANGVASLMESLGIEFTAEQDVWAVWRGIDQVHSGAHATRVKTAFCALVVIVGPFLEEFLFRGCLQGATRWIQGSDDLTARIIRVLVNALIFAACHLSPAQGYTNVPIFVGTFVMGCVFASLREATGGIGSATTAHIFNNGFAMTHFLLRA